MKTNTKFGKTLCAPTCPSRTVAAAGLARDDGVGSYHCVSSGRKPNAHVLFTGVGHGHANLHVPVLNLAVKHGEVDAAVERRAIAKLVSLAPKGHDTAAVTGGSLQQRTAAGRRCGGEMGAGDHVAGVDAAEDDGADEGWGDVLGEGDCHLCGKREKTCAAWGGVEVVPGGRCRGSRR